MQGQGASTSTPGVPGGARLRVALRALGGSRATCSWHITRTETSTSDATRRSRDTASDLCIGSWPHRRLRVCFCLRLRSLRGVSKNAAILRRRRGEPLTFIARSPQARVAGRPRRGSAWHTRAGGKAPRRQRLLCDNSSCRDRAASCTEHDAGARQNCADERRDSQFISYMRAACCSITFRRVPMSLDRTSQTVRLFVF